MSQSIKIVWSYYEHFLEPIGHLFHYWGHHRLRNYPKRDLLCHWVPDFVLPSVVSI